MVQESGLPGVRLVAVLAVVLLGLPTLLLFLLLLLPLLALSLLFSGLAVVLALLAVGLLLHGLRGRLILGLHGLGGRSGNGGSSGLLAAEGSVEVGVLALPLGRGGLVGTAELVKGTGRLHLLLLKSSGAESPAAGVEVTLHDATLDLGNNTVVAGGEFDGGHLSDTDGDGLTLGGHKDDLLVALNAGLVAEKTGDHQLSTVADGVDSAVLNDDTLVAGEQRLKRADDLAEVRLVAVVVVDPLGVHDIVQSNHTLGLVHSTGADTAKFLHVGADTEEETQVDTEGTDVGTSLTADPEDTEVALVVELVVLALVDGTDTELTLDGRDQRGTLEERTSEGLQSADELSLAAGDLVVKADDTDILLTGTLLGLDQTGGTVNADDETSSNLGIEGTTVTGLLRSNGKQISQMLCAIGMN